MSKHSKGRGTQGTFSYSERAELQLGSKRMRLGADSQKDVDACNLCLHRVKEPLVCGKGHIFCRECIYENLLNQKQEIKRAEKAFNEQQLRQKEEEVERKNAAEEASIEEFERAQFGVVPLRVDVFKKKNNGDPLFGEPEQDMEGATYEQKAKARAKRRRDEDGKKLNNWWLPQNIPDGLKSELKKPNTNTLCPATVDTDHKLKLKTLITVNFTSVRNADKIKEGSQEARFICPCCLKGITNAVTVVALKKCGHTMCKSCCDKISRIEKTPACVVGECGKQFNPKKDVIVFTRGGTGFTGADPQSEAKKVLVTSWI